MPHIIIKMLEGRSEPVKALCVSKVAEALKEAAGIPDCYISVSVEEYSAQEWQDVFAKDIKDNPTVIKAPEYDPKDLL